MIQKKKTKNVIKEIFKNNRKNNNIPTRKSKKELKKIFGNIKQIGNNKEFLLKKYFLKKEISNFLRDIYNIKTKEELIEKIKDATKNSLIIESLFNYVFIDKNKVSVFYIDFDLNELINNRKITNKTDKEIKKMLVEPLINKFIDYISKIKDKNELDKLKLQIINTLSEIKHKEIVFKYSKYKTIRNIFNFQKFFRSLNKQSKKYYIELLKLILKNNISGYKEIFGKDFRYDIEIESEINSLLKKDPFEFLFNHPFYIQRHDLILKEFFRYILTRKYNNKLYSENLRTSLLRKITYSYKHPYEALFAQIGPFTEKLNKFFYKKYGLKIEKIINLEKIINSEEIATKIKIPDYLYLCKDKNNQNVLIPIEVKFSPHNTKLEDKLYPSKISVLNLKYLIENYLPEFKNAKLRKGFFITFEKYNGENTISVDDFFGDLNKYYEKITNMPPYHESQITAAMYKIYIKSYLNALKQKLEGNGLSLEELTTFYFQYYFSNEDFAKKIIMTPLKYMIKEINHLSDYNGKT